MPLRSIHVQKPTADKAVALAALARLDAAAGEVWAVSDPALRVEAMRGPRAEPASEAAPPEPTPEPVAAPDPEPAPVPDASRTAVVQGRAWTSEQDQELREGVHFGCTLEELADQFDAEVAAVAMRLAMLGLAAPSAAG